MAIDEAQDQGIGHRDGGAFRGGEDATQNTADDNDDHQQARDALPERFENKLGVIVLGVGIAAFLGHDAGHDHASQTPNDAGDIARHEQSGDGDAACDRGVDDHDVARRDHHAGRTGGDVADRGILVGVALFLLEGSENAAHGDGRGNAGAGHGAEEHVRDDVGLGQGARQTMCHQLGAADKPSGDAAGVHQVTGEDKERNCQQREGVDALEHLLSSDDQRLGVGHNDVERGGRTHPDAQADGEAKGQCHKDEYDHYGSG